MFRRLNYSGKYEVNGTLLKVEDVLSELKYLLKHPDPRNALTLAIWELENDK